MTYCTWRVDSSQGISFRLSAHFRLTFQCWSREKSCCSVEPAERLNLPPIVLSSIVGKSWTCRTQNRYHLLKTDSLLNSYLHVNKTLMIELFPQFVRVLRENTWDSRKCEIVLTRGKHVMIFLLDKPMLGVHKLRSFDSPDLFVNSHSTHVYVHPELFCKSRFHFTFVRVLNNTEQY